MNNLIKKFLFFFKKIGSVFFEIFSSIGEIVLFFFDSVRYLFTGQFYTKIFFLQLIKIGYNSLPVVGLTSIFTGMVLALQSYTGFSRIFSRKCYSQCCCFINNKRVSTCFGWINGCWTLWSSNCCRDWNNESYRANRCFKNIINESSLSPYNYLVIPRVFAGVISLPILVFIGDIIGVLGGYLICTQVLNFNPVVYLQNTYNFVQFLDVFSGLVKAFVFGFIITFNGMLLWF